MDIETWADAEGFEGFYQISDRGRVRRLPGVIKRSNGTTLPVAGRVLKPKLKNSGYLFVTLSKQNQQSNRYIHHMVAAAFVGKRPKDMDINHIDGDKLNNRASNLEYVDRSTNMLHARKLGLHMNYGESHYNARLTDELVAEIRLAHNQVGVGPTEIAETLGVAPATIRDVINRKTWRHVK